MYLFMNEILDSAYSIHYIAKRSHLPVPDTELYRLLFVIDKNLPLTGRTLAFTEVRLLSGQEALPNRMFPAVLLTVNQSQIKRQWKQLESEPDCFLTEALKHAIGLTNEQSASLSFLFQKIISCHKESGSRPHCFLYSWLYELLCTVRDLDQNSNDDACPPVSGRDTISSVISYIKEHYMENISIDTLSATFFISKYHLMREFKKETGYTIHTFLLKQRITQAQHMITRGIPAGTASALVGFSDYSLFYRSFLKLTGISPREYDSDHDMLIAE